MSTMRRIRTSKSRRQRAASVAGLTSSPAVAREGRPRHWLMWALAAVFLVGGAVVTYGLVDYVFWPHIPVALAGTWRVQGGSQQGVTLQFDRDGAFQARMALGGKEGTVHGRAEVDSSDDKVLRIISTNPQTGQTMTRIHIIRSLTDNELRLEDPTGRVSTLVRLE